MTQTIGIASAAVALVLAGTVIWLVNKPPTADCGAEAPVDQKVHEVRAARVVVQPWLGAHHVYGIFMVPNRYRHYKQYVVTMTIRGGDRHFDAGERSDSRHGDDAVAESGYSLFRRHVPTRVALWFLVAGLFGDLGRPCNWTLVFVEQSV